MLQFLPPPLKGGITLFLIFLNTVFWNIFLYAFAVLKILIPIPACRIFFSRILIAIAENWISANDAILKLTRKINWDIEGQNGLSNNKWYLVLSNHQAWTDILVLQHTFNRRIPFLKFFLKKELIRVPILGLAWWALDYPFMKRYSKNEINKDPKKRMKDLETTRKMCARFQHTPTSILNFVEGTRYTPEKHAKQKSSYQHLLMPKAGGIAYAMEAMGDLFGSILDVTLIYPERNPTFWNFICGRVTKIIVRINEIAIPQELLHGNYLEDAGFREQFHFWIKNLWLEKDRLMENSSK